MQRGAAPPGPRCPEPAWAELIEFKGPGNNLSLLGLDSRWATNNDTSKNSSAYTLPTGLTPGIRLSLVVWNHDGLGMLSHQPAATVQTGGNVTISVPQHAVFALTTLPLPPLPGP